MNGAANLAKCRDQSDLGLTEKERGTKEIGRTMPARYWCSRGREYNMRSRK